MLEHNGEAILCSEYKIQGGDFNRAGEVSTDIKARLKKIGFDPDLVRRASIAAFEAEMNVVLYADEADVTLEVKPERIYIDFIDKGPGIPDVDLAMQEGYSTATPEIRKLGFGAGMGLPTIKKKTDHFLIESIVKQGVRVRLYFTPEGGRGS